MLKTFIVNHFLKFLFLLILPVLGCSNVIEENEEYRVAQLSNKTLPQWLENLINELNSGPVKDSPESIVQFYYKGETVFYFAPSCCGQTSKLFDKNKKLLCQPDGGRDGKGDKKCPDFLFLRKNEKQLWLENRD